MSLHHLDPRQAGTGAAPNLVTFQGTVQRKWYAHRRGQPDKILAGQCETEAAALAAARAAAGFGHVAEQPCAFHCFNLYRTEDCGTCGWSSDAHQSRCICDDYAAMTGMLHPDCPRHKVTP